MLNVREAPAVSLTGEAGAKLVIFGAPAEVTSVVVLIEAVLFE
jgi:hypothetical protein